MPQAFRLEVGRPLRVTGTYRMNWEWLRFAVRFHRPWLWPGTVLCELVTKDGRTTNPLDSLGAPLPSNWRHHPGLEFRVIADVTPIERGSFGHMRSLKWRLRVDRWLEVSPLDSNTQDAVGKKTIL